MNDQNLSAMRDFRGSEQEVLHQLREFRRAGVDLDLVDLAVRQVLDGYRHVVCAGDRLEVVDPAWSTVQDVYGCEDGRECRNISKRQRRRFEATIRARVRTEE